MYNNQDDDSKIRQQIIILYKTTFKGRVIYLALSFLQDGDLQKNCYLCTIMS